MTVPAEGSAVKQALAQIRELRARLAAAEAARAEPVAIVGLGLRFPGGARDAESFARLLWEGRDAITEVPRERWDIDTYFDPDIGVPGKMVTRFGAFLEGVDKFDADFFGIAPREAASMDPQQRLLLEIAWETLENAGIAPGGLAGSATGVYLGISNSDYGRALLSNPEECELYASTGSAFSVAAGRISYQLGLKGPSVAVDTACSSSLVALHLAAQGLRSRECDLALAGGVNLILTPEMNIVFSAGRMMAPDGRCKSFDAAADGYVRGEGCGMVALRRLSDAQARGDRILGVIRGSAINQDGRSGGLTAPNGPSQESVIRAALAAARVTPDSVSYVEAHGTGTPLGDPIEVGALVNTLCHDREAPLLIGSVKTNIGHLEAAAGIAGVVKVLLGFERGEIPPSLHFREGSPHIDWTRPIAVATAATPWVPVGGRRLAGVSSFGFAGCNAHVVLEAPPAIEVEAAAERPRHLLVLSAREPDGLRRLAVEYLGLLAGDGAVEDICYTAATGRSHFPYRLAVTGANAAGLRAALDTYLAEGEGEGIHVGHAESPPQVAFLFTGQGAQYNGMARALYDGAPAFRSALDACAEALAPHLGAPLIHLIHDGSSHIGGAALAQPLTFAVEVAMARLWQSWGIEPAAVAGHSLGAYAAACVAGMLPLAEAAKLVAARGRLTEEHALPGAMAAVYADEEALAGILARETGALGIAAFNAPGNLVLSGDPAAVQRATAELEAQGVQVRPLRVEHAAHSPLVDPVVRALRPVLEGTAFTPNRIAFVSDLTGMLAGVEEVGRADYWLSHLRQPVRFADAVRTLAAQGATHFVEVGPHPVLLGMAGETLGPDAGAWLPSIRRDGDDWTTILDSLARLHVDGAAIDWMAVLGKRARAPVALPTYPFHRRRHWIETVQRAAAPSGDDRWTRVTAALDRQANQGPLDLNAGSYPAKWALLSRITEAHAARTLAESAVFARAGERRDADAVMRAAGFKPAYRHIVGRWLDMLAASGRLRRDGGSYVADHALTEPDIAPLWAEAKTLFADNQPLLAYVRHCGGLVGRVMRGEESPLETLFPGGSTDLAEGLYERSATMRYINQLAAEAVAALDTGGSPLRIMEVGGGTGGTTSALLPVLGEHARYLFTDVSSAFFDRSRERLRHPALQLGVFDVDKDVVEQGYTPGNFDVVVSANAIHASANLPAALSRLRSLVAPGGMLVLVESTRHFDWFDMTTGLIEGWQHFADGLRDDNPLLPSETWVQALREAGFDDAGAWPGERTAAAVLGQHVIVARVSGTPGSAGTEFVVGDSGGAATVEAGSVTGALVAQIMEALPAERLDLVREAVRSAVMKVLHRTVDEPPALDGRLMEYGLDSLMAVQLRGLLGRRFELPALPASLMFDHPTIDALAKYLMTKLVGEEDAQAKPAAREVSVVDEQPNLAAAAATMSDAEIEAILMERMRNG